MRETEKEEGKEEQEEKICTSRKRGRRERGNVVEKREKEDGRGRGQKEGMTK